ncbi:TOBE domain-containing protein [Micromonospora matsumotoense]
MGSAGPEDLSVRAEPQQHGLAGGVQHTVVVGDRVHLTVAADGQPL